MPRWGTALYKVGLKRCPGCTETKALSEFHKSAGKYDGRHAHCRACSAEKWRRDYENGKRRRSRAGKKGWFAIKLKMVGMTKEDFDELMRSQESKCGICNRTVGLIIDHDHKSGRVRGLLCMKCNSGIGLLGDNLEGVEKALRYLEVYQSTA